MTSNDPSDRPTRVIRFEDGEPTGRTESVGATRVESAGDGAGPVYEPSPAYTRPPERRDVRPWLFAGAAAVALGVLGGLLLSPKREDDAPVERVEAAATETRTEAAPAAVASVPAITIAAAREPYRNPEAAAVERALISVRTDFAAGGASAVARQAQACFASLARAPSYVELDYCLAYDAYGAALARRLAQGQSLPAGSWFADAEGRALRTAQAVVAGQGDAAARLLDIRRLTVQVAAANPARTGEAEPRVVEATPPRIVTAEAPTLPRAEIAPEPPQPLEPRIAPRPSEPSPAPRPSEAAVAPTATGGARPSFNCRYARSRSERLVCSDPVLAAADWRLHNVFERAMAQTSDPRALRAEQDRWLAAREGAAPDPRAVLQVYETRIDELAASY